MKKWKCDLDKVKFNSNKIFFEIPFLAEDLVLTTAVKDCIELQKDCGGESLKSYFKLNPNALDLVSSDALKKCMLPGAEVSDIRADRSISNCIAFNSKNLDGSVMDQNLLAIRRNVDQIVANRIRSFFQEGDKLMIHDSGLFWYPPGGFMSWHTNFKTPGWRLYINYTEEPGKSFFRYRDPDTGEIVTLMDKKWNFRLFKIDPKKLFWHTVYSDTNRYSFGYRIAINWDLPLYKRAFFRARNLASLALGRGN